MIRAVLRVCLGSQITDIAGVRGAGVRLATSLAIMPVSPLRLAARGFAVAGALAACHGETETGEVLGGIARLKAAGSMAWKTREEVDRLALHRGPPVPSLPRPKSDGSYL